MSRAIARKKPTARRAAPKRRPRQDKPRGYVCSGCGFHEELPEPDWSDNACLIWQGNVKDLAKAWRMCPNDSGRDVAMLTKPDRTCQRLRDTFEFNGDEVRACTLYARVKGQRNPRPLIPETTLRFRAYREWYLRRKGEDPRIDLGHAVRATRGSLGLRVEQMGKLRVLPYSVAIAQDPWLQKIRTLYRTNPRARRFDYHELGRVLDPRMSVHVDPDAILHVPIDLRLRVDTQLQQLNSVLREIRTFLVGLTSRGRVKTRRELWRDIYVFLLSESTSRTSASIAEEALPWQDNRVKGANAVDKILARMRQEFQEFLDPS